MLPLCMAYAIELNRQELSAAISRTTKRFLPSDETPAEDSAEDAVLADASADADADIVAKALAAGGGGEEAGGGNASASSVRISESPETTPRAVSKAESSPTNGLGGKPRNTAKIRTHEMCERADQIRTHEAILI